MMNQKTDITLSFTGIEMLCHSIYGGYTATPFSLKLMNKAKEMIIPRVSVTPLSFNIDKKVVYLSLIADELSHPTITHLFFRETLRCLLGQYQEKLRYQKHNANNNLFFKIMIKNLNRAISFIDQYYDPNNSDNLYKLKHTIVQHLISITDYLYINRYRVDVTIKPKQLELYHIFVGLTLLYHKIMCIPLEKKPNIINQLFDYEHMCFISNQMEGKKMTKTVVKVSSEKAQSIVTVNQLIAQNNNLIISGIVISDGIDSISVQIDQGKKSVTGSSKLIVSPELTSFMAKSQERAILSESKKQLAETAQKLGVSIDELKKLIWE